MPTAEEDMEPYQSREDKPPMNEPGDMSGEDDMPSPAISPLDVGKGATNPNEVLQQLGAQQAYRPRI